jgi:hypothetical protein
MWIKIWGKVLTKHFLNTLMVKLMRLNIKGHGPEWSGPSILHSPFLALVGLLFS